MADFEGVVRAAVAATQSAGRHPQPDSRVLEVFTNAVPFGAAMLLSQPVFSQSPGDLDQEAFIEELVYPVAGRAG